MREQKVSNAQVVLYQVFSTAEPRGSITFQPLLPTIDLCAHFVYVYSMDIMVGTLWYGHYGRDIANHVFWIIVDCGLSMSLTYSVGARTCVLVVIVCKDDRFSDWFPSGQ